MQNTRLNTLINRIFKQFTQWVENPWRRISLIIISLLFGVFLASVIITTSGQSADLDITFSLVMLAVVELISWLRYGKIGQNISGDRPLWILILDSLKLGLVYGLFLEAFKLGS